MDILIVEDDRDTCEALVNTIKHAGYSVQGFYSSQGTLSIPHHLKPKVLIADINLGEDVDGVTLARAAVSLYGRDLGVVFVTGYNFDFKKYKLASNERFLQKPISSSTLLRTVNELIHYMANRETIHNLKTRTGSSREQP